MASPVSAALRIGIGTALFFGYPYLIYRGMGSGLVWIAPTLISFVFLYRARHSQNFESRLIHLAIGLGLILSVFCLQSVSAKFLPVLAQLTGLWFFGRTLIQPPSLIERIVRLEYPEVPAGIVEYCTLWTWIWTLFFAFNAIFCSALALWAEDRIWAWYTGVIIIVLTVLLFVIEYLYRCRRFPDLEIPDPETSLKSIWVNGRKIWSDVHAP